MILTIHKHLFLLLESELLVIKVYKISVRVCKNIFKNKLKVLDFKKKSISYIYIYILKLGGSFEPSEQSVGLPLRVLQAINYYVLNLSSS